MNIPSPLLPVSISCSARGGAVSGSSPVSLLDLSRSIPHGSATARQGKAAAVTATDDACSPARPSVCRSVVKASAVRCRGVEWRRRHSSYRQRSVSRLACPTYDRPVVRPTLLCHIARCCCCYIELLLFQLSSCGGCQERAA